jgi:hypothetical protein
MSEQPGRYQRSFPGMVGAMIVLVLVVAAFVVFREVVREEPSNRVEPVEFARPAEYARGEADFDLLAPRELPEGWIATSVRFTAGPKQAWHLGTLTDEGRYVGLEQAETPIPRMVEQHVDEAAEQGDDVTIDGETWQTWTDEDGDLALVRRSDDVTTLLVGRVSQETIEDFLTTLR